MTKTFVLASLAIVGMTFTSDNAFAGRRCCRAPRTNCCNAAPCCNATPCCNAAAPAAPMTAQAPDGNGYQSFSYEPGAPAATAVMVAPVQTRSTTSTFDQFRGDRKARGIF